MKGFLHLEGDAFPNRLNTFEVSRLLRLFVQEAPTTPQFKDDEFFLGSNTHFPARPHPDTQGTAYGVGGTTEVRRLRQFGTETYLAPAPPNQIAFSIGRVYAGHGTTIAPLSIWSEVDVNLNRVGNVFGHPASREAFFNETAVTPLGVGNVTPGGTTAFAAGQEGHYIYLIYIATSGSATGATYFYQRWPYWRGAYFPGSEESDFTGTENNDQRLYTGLDQRMERNLGGLFLQNNPAVDPSVIEYDLGYPTNTAGDSSLSSICCGAVFDGTNRLWWATTDVVDNGDVNASTSRSLWTWQRMSGEIPQRLDAADNFSSTPLTGFPALPSNVQFRTLQAGRGGFLYLSCDGEDDAGLGTANTGGLIQINTNTDAVTAVHGTTVTGIYTVGGMQSNDCLWVTVDQTESRAAAGFDRVWVQHRNGLSYADFNITTGATSGWTTVANAGADVNILDADSIRGIAGVTLTGSTRNSMLPLLDHDSNGDIYFVSSPGTTGPFTSGINRLNRLIGDSSAHTYYSLDNVAEGGATGFINLGIDYTGMTSKGCFTCTVFRPDAGDPDEDEIYISGAATSATTEAVFRRVPISAWGTGNDPGVAYYVDSISSNTQLRPLHVQVGLDGSAIAVTGTGNGGLLGSLETFTPTGGSGTGASFAAPVGNNQAVTLAGGSAFDTRWVGRKVRFAGASNATNNGTFEVVAVASGTSITVFNPTGVSETSSFTFDITGDEFDARINDAATTPGAVAAQPFLLTSYRAFPDDSGMCWLIGKSTTTNFFAYNAPFPVTYNWDSVGTQWYRRRRAQVTDGPGKTAHTTAEALDSGVTVSFSNSGAGGTEFVQDEYYTVPASIGLIKDPTQEVSYLYDFYYSETDLIARPDDAEGSTDKTCAFQTAVGGYLQGSLASVLTDDPFVLTTEQARQVAFPNRQFALDGGNNTVAVGTASATMSATDGFQMGLDMGADTVCSQLRCVLPTTLTANDIVIDLYSATAGAGASSWTLRGSFPRSSDTPGLIFRGDAFYTTAQSQLTSQGYYECIFDFGDLAGTGIFGSNIAVRYWKVVVRRGSSSITSNQQPGNLYALDAGGTPIGFTTNQYLNTAPDSNYLGNFPLRVVFVQDNNASAGGTTSRGPADNQVTLNTGTFSTDIAAGDFFRTLSGSTILQEIAVTTRDSGTQLTLAADATAFAGATWEVVRNADVRPRDDAGGGENVSQLPPTGASGQSQIYIDPVTGFFYFNDLDVTNSRTFRVERYVKIIRAV